MFSPSSEPAAIRRNTSKHVSIHAGTSHGESSMLARTLHLDAVHEIHLLLLCVGDGAPPELVGVVLEVGHAALERRVPHFLECLVHDRRPDAVQPAATTRAPARKPASQRGATTQPPSQHTTRIPALVGVTWHGEGGAAQLLRVQAERALHMCATHHTHEVLRIWHWLALAPVLGSHQVTQLTTLPRVCSCQCCAQLRRPTTTYPLWVVLALGQGAFDGFGLELIAKAGHVLKRIPVRDRLCTIGLARALALGRGGSSVRHCGVWLGVGCCRQGHRQRDVRGTPNANTSSCLQTQRTVISAVSRTEKRGVRYTGGVAKTGGEVEGA